ncbi:MAG: DSD1 family PLP-dependent enzyme [Alphaproteobacteria bacterium]|nr:DSD1 family PLP-dependent enzyme [Alphaproteobacteria bacterium]
MADELDLHRPLIGQQGSRRALNTPALVIDRDALQRNIDAMAAFANAHGVRLRPHAKTHKSADIAKLQIAAGAIGVCCAKLGEAEALADAGVSDILLTSPIVTPQAIARLIALNARVDALQVTADHPGNVAALARVATTQRPLTLYVDIDPGIRRTGVASADAAVALAQQISREPSLRYGGVQYYCGVQQHIEGYAERRAALEERTAYLQSVIEALATAGLAPAIITGGGTGTHRIDAALGVLSEWQVGSYVFMDRQYALCDLTGAGDAPFETALFIDAHVISANTPGMATIDAGFKALSTDGGQPEIVAGAPEGAKFVFMGDEHGALIARDHTFAHGAPVTLTAPHCDPTVNLYDAYHVVRGDTLIDIWPVSARGRSR